jgi:nitrate reductase gamma subunit
MDTQQWLEWLRGPGLQISFAVFVLGLVYRVLHLILLGRRENLSAPRGSEWRGGMRTIWRRSFFIGRQTSRGYFILIAGYIFHLGFIIPLLLLSQHIALFRSVLGFGWPALAPGWVTMAAVLGIAAMIASLVHRVADPVRRLLGSWQDYLAWLVTFLPLLTGVLAKQSGGADYPLLLALHIASAEVFLVVVPFTKLVHMVSVFPARWYNGAVMGYKGVKI